MIDAPTMTQVVYMYRGMRVEWWLVVLSCAGCLWAKAIWIVIEVVVKTLSE